MIDLESIKKRAAAATPAPWRWDGYPGNETKALLGPDHGAYPNDTGFVLRGSADAGGGEWFTEVGPEDAEFIAHAREDIPALVAYVERLEKYALDGMDAHCCDACSLVFDVDEGEYGEDCWLCETCAAQAREGIK